MGELSSAPVGLLLAITVLGNVLAAFLSAGESSVLRITRAGAAELVEAHPRLAPRIEVVLVDPGRSAAACAFLRVIAETVAATCLTVAVAALWEPWLLVIAVTVLVSAVIAVLLVRVSPRSLGRREPVRTLAGCSAVVWFAVRTTGHLPLAVSGRARLADERDERDLQEMVDRVNESEAIEDDERDMLRSVFELSSTLTREVMVPRTDMVVIDSGDTLRHALRMFLRSGFSRMPVVGESTDDLLGVLYFKDVVRVIDTGTDDPEAPAELRPVDEVMRPAIFVPESKPVDDLLADFRVAVSHVALVVDEYGGIAGLVTVEDALEEIVGELTDEHDTAPPEVEDLGDGVFRVPTRLPVDELGDLFGLELDDDDVDTVGGLLAKALGKVPLPGEVCEIEGLRIEAERTEGRRRRLATVLAGRVHAEHDAVDGDAATATFTDPRTQQETTS